MTPNNATKSGVVVTLIAIVMIVATGADSFWGLNHFKYLGDFSWYLLALLCLASLCLAFGPLPQRGLDRTITKVDRLLWGKSTGYRWGLAFGFTALFYFLRVGTAFLGDGYFLLNIFGRGEGYIAYSLKPLSIVLIKAIQQLFGGYTYWTALYAFQAISIASGFVVVLNFVAMSKSISSTARGRLLTLGLMLFSGWILLYFGYVEYYPLLWMAATFFLRYGLSYVQGRTAFWPVLFLFIIAAGVHLQALYFLPGVSYLLAYCIAPKAIERLKPATVRWIVGTMIVGLLGAVFLVSRTVPEISNPFLALLPFGILPPDYAIISLTNLMEVGNLIWLCIPSILILAALWRRKESEGIDHTARFLGLLSVGSLAYLFTVDPRLGMARDFDMMSLTLLAPLLLLLRRVAGDKDLPLRAVLVALVLSLFVTGSFLSVNFSVERSEKRIHDLLKYYGAKEKGGWFSFVQYLENNRKTEWRDRVAREIDALFPEQRTYRTAMSLTANGKFDEAEYLLQNLLARYPDNGEYLAALADIRFASGDFKEAASLYEQALGTHPNHRTYLGLGRSHLAAGNLAPAIGALETANSLSPQTESILTELCRACARANQLDRAKRLADELLTINPDSPDGHIVNIIYLARAGRNEEATRHYQWFLNHGEAHPEFETIKEKYRSLLGDRTP